MIYKVIAFDFDGTLLNDERKVGKLTKEEIYTQKAKGKIIVGVTARTLESVKEVVDLDVFDYLILNNGAYLFNVQENTGKYLNEIPFETAKNITEEYESICNQIDYCSGNVYYTYKGLERKNLSFIKYINSLQEVKEKIARMNLYLKDNEKIKEYNKKINKKYQNVFSFVMQDSKSIKKWLVINPEKLNKGTTLIELGKILGIELNEIIFFGDGLNDLEIMQTDCFSVAMENALPDIKEVADDITLSNNDDGIAVYLQRLK